MAQDSAVPATPIRTTVDLLRHGEPVGGPLFRGWRDDPLSDLGWRQMRHSVERQQPWERIISSPLRRCAEFSQELAGRCNIDLQVDERLKEIGFGEWEGVSPDKLFAQFPEQLTRFWQDPFQYPPPGGEPMLHFQSRVEAAWQDITVRCAGKHLLVVAHGGVNRMIIGKVLGMPVQHLFRMELPYAAISRITLDDGYPRLTFHCGALG